MADDSACTWKKPHVSKVYEAITAIADDRIKKKDEVPNEIQVYSSSGNKHYTVNYDPEAKEIMSNDNSAYYTDTLSYPMIALLMLRGDIEVDDELLDQLSDIYWKDINQKFNNDYDKAIDYVLDMLEEKGIDSDEVEKKIQKIYDNVCEIKLGYLGRKSIPPKAY